MEKLTITKKTCVTILAFLCTVLAISAFNSQAADNIPEAEEDCITFLCVADDEEIPVEDMELELIPVGKKAGAEESTDEEGVAVFNDYDDKIEGYHEFSLKVYEPRSLKEESAEYYKRDESGAWVPMGDGETYKMGMVYKVKMYTQDFDIPVQVFWDDRYDRAGQRPDSLDVSLLANGEAIQTITLSKKDVKDAEDIWLSAFTNLKALDENGHWIKYSLQKIDNFGRYTAEVMDEYPEYDGIFVDFSFKSGETVMVTIEARKMVNEKPAKGSDYTFLLYGDGEDGPILIDTQKNRDDKIMFNVEVDADFPVHFFKIAEKTGEKKGVTYDETVYEARVELDINDNSELYPEISYWEDLGDDEMTGASIKEDYPTFRNICKEPAAVANSSDKGAPKAPATGDENRIAPWIVGLVISALALAGISLRSRGIPAIFR